MVCMCSKPDKKKIMLPCDLFRLTADEMPSESERFPGGVRSGKSCQEKHQGKETAPQFWAKPKLFIIFFFLFFYLYILSRS